MYTVKETKNIKSQPYVNQRDCKFSMLGTPGAKSNNQLIVHKKLRISGFKWVDVHALLI